MSGTKTQQTERLPVLSFFSTPSVLGFFFFNNDIITLSKNQISYSPQSSTYNGYRYVVSTFLCVLKAHFHP